MSNNEIPDRARASPESDPKPTRLNIRFKNGGELIKWDRIQIVDETTFKASDENPDEVPIGQLSQEDETPGGQVSTMLVLQVLILTVAIVALLMAF